MHEPDKVVSRQCDEAARDLDDVEAQFAALVEIPLNRSRTLRDHVLDEAAGRDGDLVGMAEVDQLLNHSAPHQAERPAREFERIDIFAHRFEHVLEIPLAHRRVIRAANLSDAARAGLRRPRIGSQKGKSPLVGLWLWLRHGR